MALLQALHSSLQNQSPSGMAVRSPRPDLRRHPTYTQSASAIGGKPKLSQLSRLSAIAHIYTRTQLALYAHQK